MGEDQTVRFRGRIDATIRHSGFDRHRGVHPVPTFFTAPSALVPALIIALLSLRFRGLQSSMAYHSQPKSELAAIRSSESFGDWGFSKA
ncbi:hypothetical protein ABZP36_022184 [Zizania latifolia]